MDTKRTPDEPALSCLHLFGLRQGFDGYLSLPVLPLEEELLNWLHREYSLRFCIGASVCSTVLNTVLRPE
jgi:hypothetical protein